MGWLRKDNRLVNWAALNQWIPLRCNKCGAIFTTKNIGPLGSHAVHFGLNYQQCRECKHHLANLIPDQDIFRTHIW